MSAIVPAPSCGERFARLNGRRAGWMQGGGPLRLSGDTADSEIERTIGLRYTETWKVNFGLPLSVQLWDPSPAASSRGSYSLAKTAGKPVSVIGLSQGR